MELMTIIILAILAEVIIEYVKKAVPALKGETALLIASSALGILLCFTTGADVLAELGLMENIPYVGTALTGVIVGGGSNMVFDVIKRIRGAKDGNYEEPKISEVPHENAEG